jgi:hypothetical protein
MRPIAVGLVLAFAFAIPTLAHAQNKNADAEKLFDEGKALMKEHKLDEACSKFEQSDKLDPGVGNELWLADCYERSGKLAEAYKQFTATEKLAASLQDHRDAVAHKRAAALLDKLPNVGDSVAIDPVVEPLVRKVALAPEAPEAHSAPPVPTLKAPDLAPDLTGRSWLRVAAPISVVAGIVGLGFGTAFEVLAQNNRNDPNNGHQNAFTFDVASAVSLITGGLLVATGATMMLVAPLTKAEKLAFAFAPSVSPTFAGIVGQGRF